MKPLLTIIISVGVCVGFSSAAKQPAPSSRTLSDLNVIPTQVLQRSVSPRFYQSLLVSPVEGWIVVKAGLVGTKLADARVVRSELKGLYDPLALELAKEATIAGNYTVDRPNLTSPVLLHLLVYQIADGKMVLSFAHIDQPGGNQMEYYGCARILVLKNNKWTEIKGPESLQGKGWAVRQRMRNDLDTTLKVERPVSGAESTNYDKDASGRDRY
jgi:hypothetical protein